MIKRLYYIGSAILLIGLPLLSQFILEGIGWFVGIMVAVMIIGFTPIFFFDTLYSISYVDDYKASEDFFDNEYVMLIAWRLVLKKFGRIEPSYCRSCIHLDGERCNIPVLTYDTYGPTKHRPKVKYKNLRNMCPDYSMEYSEKMKQLLCEKGE